MIAAIRREMAAIDKNAPLYNVITLAAQVDENMRTERLMATLSSFFGVLAALLAAIGLYGVLSYAFGRRTREIGIRLALGASPGKVLVMVLGETALLGALGVAAGVALAYALTRYAEALLYGVTPADAPTFVAASVLLLATALLAGFIPARRASRTNPITALRYE